MPRNNLNVSNHCGAKVSNIMHKRNADENTIRPWNRKRGPQKQWEVASVSKIFPRYFTKRLS